MCIRDRDGNSWRSGERISASDDTFVGRQIHLVIGVFGISEVAALSLIHISEPTRPY